MSPVARADQLAGFRRRLRSGSRSRRSPPSCPASCRRGGCAAGGRCRAPARPDAGRLLPRVAVAARAGQFDLMNRVTRAVGVAAPAATDCPSTPRKSAASAPSSDRHRASQRRRTPWLQQGQREADDEDGAPERVTQNRSVDAEKPNQNHRHDGEEHDLQVPAGEVLDRVGSHQSSFSEPAASCMSRLMCCRSSLVRRPSFARCNNSPPAAPSKTRSTKSRTIAPTTC